MHYMSRQQVLLELLDEPSIGFEGRQPNYFWVRHPLFDITGTSANCWRSRQCGIDVRSLAAATGQTEKDDHGA